MQCYESIGMCYAGSEHVACHEAAPSLSFLAFNPRRGRIRSLSATGTHLNSEFVRLTCEAGFTPAGSLDRQSRTALVIARVFCSTPHMPD